MFFGMIQHPVLIGSLLHLLFVEIKKIEICSKIHTHEVPVACYYLIYCLYKHSTFSATKSIQRTFTSICFHSSGCFFSCSVNWETEDVATTSYIVFLFAMGLVLPLVTILCSYLGILITIRMVKSKTNNK
jgi:hypothetical protein